MKQSARKIHFIPAWRLIPETETMNNDGNNGAWLRTHNHYSETEL